VSVVQEAVVQEVLLSKLTGRDALLMGV